jgi:hypothetical protein
VDIEKEHQIGLRTKAAVKAGAVEAGKLAESGYRKAVEIKKERQHASTLLAGHGRTPHCSFS